MLLSESIDGRELVRGARSTSLRARSLGRMVRLEVAKVEGEGMGRSAEKNRVG